MKREDLYRNRGKNIRNRPQVRQHRNVASKSAETMYPLCHLLQISITILLFVILSGSRLLFSEELSQTIQTSLKSEMENSIQMPKGEWSGTLKEILFMEK